jgi:hypothetical protein
VECVAQTLSPPNEPTVRGELIPRIYYAIGLAYEARYNFSAVSQVSRQLSVENFIEALNTRIAAYPDAQDSAFAEMCLTQFTEFRGVSTDFEVSYPDGKHRAIDELIRVKKLKFPRLILKPLVMPD